VLLSHILSMVAASLSQGWHSGHSVRSWTPLPSCHTSHGKFGNEP
jgi:hypothetical protein